MIVGIRTLTYDDGEGRVQIPVTLFMPASVEGKWDCAYEIGWPDRLWTSHVQGNDALHALQLAMQKICLDIYMSPYHLSGRLTWIEPWVGYGFAPPKDARDLLIGSDREFFG